MITGDPQVRDPRHQTRANFTSLDASDFSVDILLDAVSVTPTPEPSALAISGLGVFAFILYARRLRAV